MKNKQIILGSLGGAAIAAGVWYYFCKRNISVAQRYENLFQQYEKEFFLSAVRPLTTQIKFDQLFELATHDENDKSMIYNRLQYQGEVITNQGKCPNSINVGSVYYDCYDCSPIRQNLTKNPILAESFDQYLVICEDCFDVSKHRGHKFEKLTGEFGSKLRCNCGDPNLMDKHSFCESHQGFDRTREISAKQKQESPILWKGIEKFLLDSFYMVFNRMSDLMMKKKSGQNLGVKDTDQIARLNIYFGQIRAKINEIIELNPPSVHNMTQIFQQKLQRPVSLQEVKRNEQPHRYNERWIPVFSNQKKINNEISVYEYLLIFYQFINDSNDTLLNKLFSTLNSVNESFNLFLIEKFTKYISFTLREDNLMKKVRIKDISFVNEKALPSFVLILIEQVALQKVFDHLIDSLGEDIFCPFDMMTQYLEVKTGLQDTLDYLVYFLSQITFSPFYFITQIKKLLEKFPLQTIERFNTLSLLLFKTNSTHIKYLDQQQKKFDITILKNNIAHIYPLILVENFAIEQFVSIISALLLLNNETLSQTILSHLCSTFQRDILKAREFIDSHSLQKFKSFSLFFLTKLPILIALSERKIFSKETANAFFSKNFTFSENGKQSKSYFFSSLQILLNTFVYNQYSSPNYYEIFSQAEHSNRDQDLIALLDLQVGQYISAKTKMYDFFTLTSSLLLLVDDTDYPQEFSPTKHIVLQCQNEISHITLNAHHENELFYSNLFIKQMQQQIFDPLPMMNIFGSMSSLYFPESNNSSSQKEQGQFASNIKQHIITFYQIFGLHLKDENQLVFYEAAYFDQFHMIRKYLDEVFVREENGSNQQQLILQAKHIFNLSFRSFLKENHNKIQEYMNIAEGQYPDEKYSLIESNLNFDDLFQYQKDLYKKIYLNYDFQLKLQQLQFYQLNYITILAAYQHVYMTLLLIGQTNNKNVFSNEEEKVVSKIIDLFADKRYLEFYLGSCNHPNTKDILNVLKFIEDKICVYILHRNQESLQNEKQQENETKQELKQQSQEQLQEQEQNES